MPSSSSDPRPGRGSSARAYLQVILAGTLWATGGPFSVALHRTGLPPESVALLRPLVGLGLLALIVAAVRGAQLRPPPGTLPGLLFVGGGIVGAFQLSYQMSTAAVGVPATVALLYLAPALVVAASPFVLGERPGLVRAGLALLSVIGVWLTVLGARGLDVELSAAGVAWGCLCGASYAAYTIFGRWYSAEPGPLGALLWSTAGGTALLAAAWWLRGVPVILPGTARGWALLLAFALLTMAAAPLLLFHAMKTLEAGRASIGTTVEPLVAALLAMLLLDQVLTPAGWIGMALLVTGVTGAYAAGAGRLAATPREPVS